MATITRPEPADTTARAWPVLAELQAGDEVPASLYVLDYGDGARPRWTVHEVQELGSGVRKLTLVDPSNGTREDLLSVVAPVALMVLTCERWTLRSQPYELGTVPTPMLCNMDQQARHVAKSGAEGDA